MILLKTIKSNPDNPRIIKDDKFKKLCNSIQALPKMMELRPIIVDSNNVVQGGNMRLKALIELGYTEVPEEWIKKAEDFTEEELKEFVIKDNVGFGEWDWDELANSWDTDKLQEWGLDLPIFDKSKTDDLDDLSDSILPEYRIEIILHDEKEQEITYNKLIGEGYECRILTL